ncbi:YbaN family protein [Pseudoalteromonas xiamenensis]|uniref:YbaN family protein n=1 Tax=Pseudoalteromonas xiamenensis TaxID=882626 RepID=UPI0035EBFA27
MKFLFTKRFWLHIAGIAFVGLGFLGLALPVMPTTVFFILALVCFTRSSPEFAQRLLDHPKYGPSLRLWQDHRVIPMKGKCMAGTGMLLGFVILCFSSAPLWVIFMVGGIELAVLYYICTRPSKVPSHCVLKRPVG